jgi:hypothetical protein
MSAHCCIARKQDAPHTDTTTKQDTHAALTPHLALRPTCMTMWLLVMLPSRMLIEVHVSVGLDGAMYGAWSLRCFPSATHGACGALAADVQSRCRMSELGEVAACVAAGKAWSALSCRMNGVLRTVGRGAPHSYLQHASGSWTATHGEGLPQQQCLRTVGCCTGAPATGNA